MMSHQKYMECNISVSFFAMGLKDESEGKMLFRKMLIEKHLVLEEQFTLFSVYCSQVSTVQQHIFLLVCIMQHVHKKETQRCTETKQTRKWIGRYTTEKRIQNIRDFTKQGNWLHAVAKIYEKEIIQDLA